jgi:hypothetical protein
MVILSRVRFTNARVEKLKEQLRNKTGPDWLKDGIIKTNDLYIADRQVVPAENVDDVLRQRMYDKKNKPIPFSRDPGYDHIQTEYLGISRRVFYEWLSKQKIHQEQLARPAVHKRQGMKISRRGILQTDLVEARTKDLAPLGRKRPTYIYTVVDLLTGFLVATELRSKTAKQSAVVLDRLLNKMEKEIGAKTRILQHDDGGEFKGQVLTLLKKRGIKNQVVRTGPRIEQANQNIQQRLYPLIAQRRGGTFEKLIQEAVDMVNNTKSRISKFSPTDAVKEADALLSARFNATRQTGSIHKLPRLEKGDRVRILKKARKGVIDYKKYRAKHFSAPHIITDIRGQAYTVNGKTYSRDRLQKVPGVDKKSEKLVADRIKPPKMKRPNTRAQELRKIKEKARIAPRRSPRDSAQ